jgi:hypothetical protein
MVKLWSDRQEPAHYHRITINNQSIEYFEHLQDREQVRCTILSHSLVQANNADCQVSVICFNVLYQLNLFI